MSWPTRTNCNWLIFSTRCISSPSGRSSRTRMAITVGWWNFSSCLNRTVSPPSFTARSPAPRVTVRIGGACASESAALASAETCGHCSRPTFFAATCIANAMHVGKLQSPQLVLGRCL